jgi:dTMP kinase
MGKALILLIFMVGVFIVFDGPPGSGKGTMIKRAFEYIFDKSKNFDNILITDEPTRGPFGTKVRSLLKMQKASNDFKDELFQAFWDDRKWHVDEIIAPALEKGFVVICDRYKYSSIAYQSVQGTDFEKVFLAHKDFLSPDLTLILDVDSEVGYSRTKKDSAEKRVESDKFREIDFVNKVREKFIEQKKLFLNENIVLINANLSEEEVFLQIKNELDKVLFK